MTSFWLCTLATITCTTHSEPLDGVKNKLKWQNFIPTPQNLTITLQKIKQISSHITKLVISILIVLSKKSINI